MEQEASTNPYAAARQDTPAYAERPGYDFGETVRRWEKLRLIYNGVLTLTTLLVTGILDLSLVLQPGYWAAIGLGAMAANLCFMTGPAIEGYSRHFGYWSPFQSHLLFLAGLGLAVMLAVGSISSLVWF